MSHKERGTMCCNGFRIILMFTMVVIAFSLNIYIPALPVVLWYLIAINSFTFLLFGVDKYYALKNRSRLEEKSFHFFAIAGGFLGLTLGMAIFRHKIHSKGFIAIELLISLIWLLSIYLVINNLPALQEALGKL